MPLDTEKTIGSHGLEQGGANLGNDYTNGAPHIEQNQTTNVGKKGTTVDGNSNARHDLTSGYTPEQMEEVRKQQQEKENK